MNAKRPNTSTRAVQAAFADDGHDHQRCVDDALAAAERLCNSRGERLTPLRRRVLELIWQNHRPIGAYDVMDLLRGERGRVAPPTVYRALEFLCAQGLVHRVESLNAFIGCGDPEHGHRARFLICRACGLAAEIEDGELEQALNRLATRSTFTVESQTVELTGLCAQCGSHGAAGG
jgi:Fur family zinc uptake transcriptional regulator